MSNLHIASKLEIRAFDSCSPIQIALKQGNYDYVVNNGDVVINSVKEPVDIASANWEFFGEEGYYSHASDCSLVSIQDKKNNKDNAIDPYDALDTIENFEMFGDFALFEIPCGNGGGYYIYTAKNEKGHIVAVRLTDVEPDEI